MTSGDNWRRNGLCGLMAITIMAGKSSSKQTWRLGQDAESFHSLPQTYISPLPQAQSRESPLQVGWISKLTLSDRLPPRRPHPQTVPPTGDSMLAREPMTGILIHDSGMDLLTLLIHPHNEHVVSSQCLHLLPSLPSMCYTVFIVYI